MAEDFKDTEEELRELKPLLEKIPQEALDFYGFREAPFSIAANPRFLFLSSEHQAAMAKMIYVMQSRQGLALCVGDVGSGKTTLAKLVHQSYEDDPRYDIRFITNPRFPSEMQLLRFLCNEMGLEMKRSYQLQFQTLQGYLTERFAEDKNVVLIIDEAQLLKGSQFELLRQILNIETNESKLCQLLLFAQSEIQPKLRAKKALRKRIATYSHLSSLDPSDMRKMIDFRCNVAGRKEPLFTEEALTEIYDITRGIPRDVVVVAINVIPIAAMKGLSVINKETILEAMNQHNV